MSVAATRQLLQQQRQQKAPAISTNFVPQGRGCDGLLVKLTAEKTDSKWYSKGPVIQGQIQLLNPNTYGMPIAGVLVAAQSSDGQVYRGYAKCQNGRPATYVPVNPEPYTYGQAMCAYRIQLDNSVFGAFAANAASGSVSTSAKSVKLTPMAASTKATAQTGSSNGGSTVQAKFLPSGNGNNNNGYDYYPPSSPPTWTVTAVATIGLSNAECPSRPVTVDTASWWSWLVGELEKKHHHNG